MRDAVLVHGILAARAPQPLAKPVHALRLAGPRTIAQGTAIGRTGRVSVRPDGAGSAWIGGAVHVLIEGTLAL